MKIETTEAEVQNKLFTIAEYLAMEGISVEKNQFDNGKIIPMAGGTYEHNLISANCIGAVGNKLKEIGKPCVVLSSDQKIQVAAFGRFFYADGSVVCDGPQFFEGRRDVIENPTLIIEVASESTELFDRTEKFERYSSLSSFKEYVLVSQKQPHVEVWTFVAANVWEVRIYKKMEDKVVFKTLDCSIDFEKIYENIVFEKIE